MGIRNKIMVILTILIVIPLIVLGAMSYRKSATILEDALISNTKELNENIAEGIVKDLSGYLYGVEAVAENINAVGILDHPEYEPFLRNLFSMYVDNYPYAYQMYMGTEDKELKSEPDSKFDDSYDPRGRAWYIKAKESGTSGWTDIYVDAVTRNYTLAGYAPVYKNNDFIGAVSTRIELSTISNEILNVDVGKEGYVFVLDQDGDVLFHGDTSTIGKKIIVREIIDGIVGTPAEGIAYYEYEGREKMVVFKYIPETRWYIMTSMYMDEISESTGAILLNSVIVGIISLIFAAFMGLLFANSITRPIKSMVATMGQVEKGDMTVISQVKSKDEIGRLSKSFNKMIEQVHSLISNAAEVSMQVSVASTSLAENAEVTSATTQEVVKTVEEIAHGATEQARDAEGAVHLASNLDTKLNQLTMNSKEIADNADNVQNVNSQGAKILVELKDATNNNIISTEKVTKAVHQLDEKSEDIGNILATISSIADQTNLLALNASIEAARAGEHGKGFAVVADEIRKLAEESSKSASQIGKIVKAIQNQTSSTVEIVEDVKKNADLQYNSVTNMDVSFTNISEAISGITSKIQNIDAFINEILHDKDEIVTAITNISSVSEETAAASEEVSATTELQNLTVEAVADAANQLRDLSANLSEQIDKFTI